MKYRSLAVAAALFAAASLIAGPISPAVAKEEAAHSAKATVAAPQLVAEAARFGDTASVRIDAQPVASTTASSSEDSSPMNLWALIGAGLAVMSSLAFRRAPHK